MFCLSDGIIRKFALFVIDTEAAEKTVACQAESLYTVGSSKTRRLSARADHFRQG
jgi:hypothetical protein